MASGLFEPIGRTYSSTPLIMHLTQPLLLFYPTSPVHVRDLRQVIERLPGWNCRAVVHEPLSRVAPGISMALQEHGLQALTLDMCSDIETLLPVDTAVLILGAVFEPFALDLLAWAKLRRIPAVAIEEVAQLALNQNDINNYDAPFDRLFVASPGEFEQFVSLGYPPEMLSISGLLANDRMQNDSHPGARGLMTTLGIGNGLKPIVYTTSPPRSRLAIHNKDDLAFRATVLNQIAIAGRRVDRVVVIKLHPNEDLVRSREWIRRIVPGAIVIGREVPMDMLFAVAGVLVNRGNSQTCLESALRGVPTVVIACGQPSLFHDFGGACIVETIDALPDAIAQTLTNGHADVSILKARHFHYPPEGVSGFVAQELADLIATRPSPDETGWNWLIKSVLFVGGHARALQLARRLDPDSEWRIQLAAALEAHLGGRRNEAIEKLLECAASDPDWYFPHYELAHNYLATENYPCAIDHARKAIELHPPFHGLWHELPMRVVIMASLRGMGNGIAAAAELAALAERSLVDVVPELQIEKATQMIGQGKGLHSAYACLKQALGQLTEFPVNDVFDGELRERALVQLHLLAENWESEQEYPSAADCYCAISGEEPENAWPRFALARVGLAQGRPLVASRILFGISGIPGAARAITERALPDSAAAVLAPFWPSSRGGILKSFKLVARSFAWLVTALRKTPGVWPNPAAVCLLLTLFVLRHLAHWLIR